MNHIKTWKERASSPDEVMSHLKDNAAVFIHGASATPMPLIEALCKRQDLKAITTYHLHLLGDLELGKRSTPWIRPTSFFTGKNLRDAVNEGRADHIPIFLSDIPALFTSRTVNLDAALVQLSPPDTHGYCSLGTSVDAARAAVDTASVIFAEINEQMPRTHGNSMIHLSQIQHYTATNRQLLPHPPKVLTAVDEQIGQIIADLVSDGSTLQLGIGAIPDAVLKKLTHKKDLGIHTEMFSDGLVDLFQSGAITNARKNIHPGRIVTSFISGTKKVFDFVNDNPIVEFYPCDRTNDTTLISKNDSVVAINSALQIDLSGQVCADSLGRSIYSGIGGQMDFIRGAAQSRGGKAIIALPSTAAHGTTSRIVPVLTEGSGVVTTRGHIQWVVTEYGAVNLHGQSLRRRADLLISIAHPDFREELRRQL
jgi:acyl-CoA hydrolase